MKNQTPTKHTIVRCNVTDAEIDSPHFGRDLGTVYLSTEEARHFSASGPHNARVSLTDDQIINLGLPAQCDNYITIREA